MPALQYHNRDTLFLLCWRRWVVSREDIEQKTAQFVKQYTGVSKAVWPSNLRCYFALGKGRRRIMLLKRLLSLYRRHFGHLFDAMQPFFKRLFTTCSCTVHVVVVVMASDIIEFLCMLYNWPIQLLLTMICTTTGLIVVCLVSSNIQRKRESTYLFKNKFTTIGSKREQRSLIESKLADSPLTSISSMGHEGEKFEHQSVLISFAYTPMPATPLVRVMETINLSSDNVEHFPTQDLSVAQPAREDQCQPPLQE
jgi:hypothetical protein